MRLTSIATTLVLALSAASAHAHDFWIQPSSLRPALDARVELVLRVGERFVGDEVPRRSEKIVRFVALAPQATESAVPGVDERSPAGYFRSTVPGVHWVAYQSKPVSIELLPAKFESYLKDEGLDHVLRARAERGEAQKPGKEIYSRCAKALLVVGKPPAKDASAPSADFERVAGLPLELVPASDWSRAHAGDVLGARLLFRGQPLANALVGCMPQADPKAEVRLRTDAQGRVSFTTTHAGTILVRVVHMVEGPKESGADWESFWASIVFDLAPATQPATPASAK